MYKAHLHMLGKHKKALSNLNNFYILGRKNEILTQAYFVLPYLSELEVEVPTIMIFIFRFLSYVSSAFKGCLRHKQLHFVLTS